MNGASRWELEKNSSFFLGGEMFAGKKKVFFKGWGWTKNTFFGDVCWFGEVEETKGWSCGQVSHGTS